MKKPTASNWPPRFLLLLAFVPLLALAGDDDRAIAPAYTEIHRFGNPNEMAAYPYAPPIEGGDGARYGTTVSVGRANLGTVFCLKTVGPKPSH